MPFGHGTGEMFVERSYDMHRTALGSYDKFVDRLLSNVSHREDYSPAAIEAIEKLLTASPALRSTYKEMSSIVNPNRTMVRDLEERINDALLPDEPIDADE